MYEVLYATTRLARVTAADPHTAKHRFAAFALYDECEHIASDVELSFGDDAELTPVMGDAPLTGTRDELRAWNARREAQTEAFEVNVFEDPERSIDAYLRVLATNDPWRLEGHGSLGRRRSAIAMFAQLITFDGRVRYRFDATQFLDYLRLDVLAALDPAHPRDSLNIDSLVDVAGLHDEGVRQIASSYTTIAGQLRLTSRYAADAGCSRAYDVVFDPDEWDRYLAHRRSEPQRFLPPAGWRSPFPTYDADS